MKPKISIVKIGGNVISNEEKLTAFLSDFAKIEGKKVLIHGGGKLATEFSEKLNIKTKLIDGRRVTDADTLDVITMVYGGLINKKIVAILQKNNTNAIGLSGADANIITASKRPVKAIDYGYVGDVKTVNTSTLLNLLENGITPVFCSITHDKNGQLLNTNADTITAEVAIALSKNFETSIFYCFEKNGVLENINDDTSVIPHLNKDSYSQCIKNGIIANGMLPKLHNCFYALDNGVSRVSIGNEKIITNQQQFFTLLTL
ncbi:acetylglutamate kinase [Flavobacteriaceae bacterium R38]|nr:acetylglutamate kinase [Flavobacteriaceae bacterium R38]